MTGSPPVSSTAAKFPADVSGVRLLIRSEPETVYVGVNVDPAPPGPTWLSVVTIGTPTAGTDTPATTSPASTETRRHERNIQPSWLKCILQTCGAATAPSSNTNNVPPQPTGVNNIPRPWYGRP